MEIMARVARRLFDERGGVASGNHAGPNMKLYRVPKITRKTPKTIKKERQKKEPERSKNQALVQLDLPKRRLT